MNTILSGIKPTGSITLGNYLGAIKNFVKLQKEMKDSKFYIFIADLHAITVPNVPAELRRNIKSLAAIYIASGLDLETTSLFLQSEVRAHAEIGYIMQSICYVPELERMTQYKDKKAKQVKGVSSALLTYPALMAGDILLYNADYVPVGDDQKQHLEITRNLAERFNTRYSETFKLPEPLVSKVGAKIMSLQNPTKKMSKTDLSEKGCIYLLDDEKTIRRKIASAVTDSEGIVKFDPVNKPGVSNLINILASVENKTIDCVMEDIKDLNYAALKETVADAVVKELMSVQAKYNEILSSNLINEVLDKGRDEATYVSNKMIRKIYKKVGVTR